MRTSVGGGGRGKRTNEDMRGGGVTEEGQPEHAGGGGSKSRRANEDTLRGERRKWPRHGEHAHARGSSYSRTASTAHAAQQVFHKEIERFCPQHV